MSDENVALVRAVYAALSRGDIEAALAWGAPDAVHDWSRSIGPYRGVYEGFEALRTFWTEFRNAVEDVTFDVEETVEVGLNVIAMVRVRIRGRGSGAEAVGRGAHLWTVKDGKVVRFVLFQDKPEALEAVGLGTEPAQGSSRPT
jgi:ketosteroid isomerase-like protein